MHAYISNQASIDRTSCIYMYFKQLPESELSVIVLILVAQILNCVTCNEIKASLLHSVPKAGQCRFHSSLTRLQDVTSKLKNILEMMTTYENEFFE